MDSRVKSQKQKYIFPKTKWCISQNGNMRYWGYGRAQFLIKVMQKWTSESGGHMGQNVTYKASYINKCFCQQMWYVQAVNERLAGKEVRACLQDVLLSRCANVECWSDGHFSLELIYKMWSCRLSGLFYFQMTDWNRGYLGASATTVESPMHMYLAI